MNELQQNQWHVMDYLASLWHGQKRIPERMKWLESRLEHMEGHIHYAFSPPSSLGNGPNNPTLVHFPYHERTLVASRFFGFFCLIGLFVWGYLVFFFCLSCGFVIIFWTTSLVWIKPKVFYIQPLTMYIYFELIENFYLQKND